MRRALLALTLLGCEDAAVDPAVRAAALERCGMDPERTPDAPVSARLNGAEDLFWVGLVDFEQLPVGADQGRVEELELSICRGSGIGVERLHLWGGLDLQRAWVSSYGGRLIDTATGADVLLGPGDLWAEVHRYEGNRSPSSPGGELDARVDVDAEGVRFEADLRLVWGELERP